MIYRDSLTGEAQMLWISVFTHFNRLYDSKVMNAKEIAAVFVPCLVADRSPYQDKVSNIISNIQYQFFARRTLLFNINSEDFVSD